MVYQKKCLLLGTALRRRKYSANTKLPTSSYKNDEKESVKNRRPTFPVKTSFRIGIHVHPVEPKNLHSPCMDQGKAMEILIKKFVRPSGKISNSNLILKSNMAQREAKLMSLPELESVNPIKGAVESSNEVQTTSSRAVNFLKIYFDFAFYICTSPFHFQLDRNGWFVVKTFKPQQIVCALLHLLGTLRLLTEVRRNVPDVLHQTPEEYFAVIGGACRLAFKILTMKRLWVNQRQFLDIVNFLQTEKTLPSSKHKLQQRYLLAGLCVVCTLMPVVMTCSDVIHAPVNFWDQGGSWWNRGDLVNDGRFAFFLINRTQYLRERSAGHMNVTTSSFDYVLAIIQGVGLLERLLIGYYFDACLLFAVLTLWCTTSALASNLRDSDHYQAPLRWTDLSSPGRQGKSTVKWVDLYKSYKGIRFLSHLINCAYGAMTTAYVAESILYHSMNLDAFVLTRNLLSQMHLLFFVVSSSLTFLFSADVCSQMDTLKLWLAKDDNRRAVPLDELNIVLHELNTGVVGIRGSNIFTITYSLIWNMLTTVVTFFVICLQSRNAGKMGNEIHST